MKKVCAIGEILIDFVQRGADEAGYPLLQALPGGAPANFLAAAAKYGCRRAMTGKVGNDAFGHLLTDTLQKAGIDTHNVIIDDNYFTTLAFVTLEENGQRHFSFARKPGADTQITSREIDFDIIESTDLFHFGTLSLTHSPAKEATEKRIDFARENGRIISFDPNIRLNLWDSEEKARQAAFYGFSRADIIKLSDEECEFLYSLSPEKAAAKIMADFGPKLIFVTLGPKGCYYLSKGFEGYAPCPQGIKAVDTTGAGDIFTGRTVSRLLDNIKTPDDIDKLTFRQVEYAARFGCGAASLSTLKNGGISSVPEIRDVENILGI